MNENEIAIRDGLQQAIDNLMNLSVTELSDELITFLLVAFARLEQYSSDTETEAVTRACDGVCFDGFTLKENSRRRIVDEVGAIEALRSVDPALVPICQNTKLANIGELEARLGKARFENIFGPYIERHTWPTLTRVRSAQ